MIAATKPIVSNETKTICPECCGVHFEMDFARSELVCKHCGTVIESKFLDLNPPRYNSESEYGVGYGDPVKSILPGRGLGSEMGSLRHVAPYNKSAYRRLSRTQKTTRIRKAVDRNTTHAFPMIRKWCSYIDVNNNIADSACRYYKMAVKGGLVRGRSCEFIASGCLAIACVQSKNPNTIGNIAEVSGVKRKDVARSQKIVKRGLNLKTEIVHPRMYVPKFCSDLEVSTAVEKKARTIIDSAVACGIDSGRRPRGITAVAILIACELENEKRTKRLIAKVSGISEVTLKDVRDLMYRHIDTGVLSN